jgi:hypothetical protein
MALLIVKPIFVSQPGTAKAASVQTRRKYVVRYRAAVEFIYRRREFGALYFDLALWVIKAAHMAFGRIGAADAKPAAALRG